MSFPSPEDARRLHERVLAGDDLARSELAEAFLRPLVECLLAVNPDADPHDVNEAVEATLLDYLAAPHRYRPHLSGLRTYLSNAARCDLLNVQARAIRRRRHLEPVALDNLAGNNRQSDQPLLRLIAEEEAAAVRQVVDEVEARSTPREVRVLRLIVDGVKATEIYAEALGVSHLPPDEQQDVVKREKDKTKKRLTRRYKRHG